MHLALLLLAPTAFSAAEPEPPSPADARRVVIRAVDDRGHPVPTATLSIGDEDLRRRVDPRTGRWAGRGFHPDHSLPQPFHVGRELALTVSAPGYLPRTVHYRVQRSGNRIVIPMEPMDGGFGPPDALDVGRFVFDPAAVDRLTDLGQAEPWLRASFSELLLAQGPSTADAALEWAEFAMADAYTTSGADFIRLLDGLYRVRAMAHHVKWQHRELASVADGSRKSRIEAERSRRLASSVASEWVQWAHAAGLDTRLPTSLCMASSTRPLDCTP